MMPTDTSERGEESTATRRAVLEAAGAGSAVSALAALFSTGAAATDVDPEPASGGDDLFDVERTARAVFPQSVASGGPTPAGAIVWTRIDEAAYEGDRDVGLQVTPAPDDSTPNEAADFSTDTQHFRVPAAELAPEDDYTLSVDLDGELGAGRFYFYRFVFDGDASPVGRLRTLPEPDADPDRLKLACVSCNRYEQGYYGAFAHMAREDADYILYLGDFIYEYGGSGDFPGRDIRLPSGKGVAHTLKARVDTTLVMYDALVAGAEATKAELLDAREDHSRQYEPDSSVEGADQFALPLQDGGVEVDDEVAGGGVEFGPDAAVRAGDERPAGVVGDPGVGDVAAAGPTGADGPPDAVERSRPQQEPPVVGVCRRPGADHQQRLDCLSGEGGALIDEVQVVAGQQSRRPQRRLQRDARVTGR